MQIPPEKIEAVFILHIFSNSLLVLASYQAPIRFIPVLNKGKLIATVEQRQ